MQTEIRATAKEDFEQLDRFVDLKKLSKLLSPETIAGWIANLLFSEEFEQDGILDTRNFL